MHEEAQYNQQTDGQHYLSLARAAKERGVSQDYLRFLIFKNKLQGLKIGRNWVTTNAWLDAYVQHNGHAKFRSANPPSQTPESERVREQAFTERTDSSHRVLSDKPVRSFSRFIRTYAYPGFRVAGALTAIAATSLALGTLAIHASQKMDSRMFDSLASEEAWFSPTEGVAALVAVNDRVHAALQSAVKETARDLTATPSLLASSVDFLPDMNLGDRARRQFAGVFDFITSPFQKITDSFGLALCKTLYHSCGLPTSAETPTVRNTPLPPLLSPDTTSPASGTAQTTPAPASPQSLTHVTEITRVREVVERTAVETLLPADLAVVKRDILSDIGSINNSIRVEFAAAIQGLRDRIGNSEVRFVNVGVQPSTNVIAPVALAQKLDKIYDVTLYNPAVQNGITVASGNVTIGSGQLIAPSISLTSQATSSLTNLTVSGNLGIGTTTPWGYVSVNPNNIGSGPEFVIGSSTKTDLVITNTGNVGVGTTTPGSFFSVAGPALFNGALTSYGNLLIPSFTATSTTPTSTIAGYLDVLGIGSNATSTYSSNLWVKGGLQIGTGSVHIGTNYLNFTQSASTSLASALNAWNINNLLSLDTVNSRIGISTSTPQFTLANQGNFYTSGAGFFGNTLTATSTVLLATAGGNVGIGTTSPGARMDLVQGTNGQIVLRGRRITDTAPTGDFLRFTTADGATSLYRVDNSGNVFQGGVINSGSISITSTSTSTPQLRVQYDSTDEQTVTVSSAGATTFAFNGTAPTASWVPQSNSVNTFSFNDASSNSILSVDTTNRRVGVGTTTPGSLLSIQGVGNFVSAATSTLYTDVLLRSLNATSTLYLANGSAATPSLAFASDAYTGLFRPASSQLAFSTGGSERVRIESTGNVGIGTTSPAQLLSVAGHCVTGDTLLKRRRRKKKADGTYEDEFEDVRIDEIQAGDEIRTLDEYTGKLVVSRVNALMDMGVKPIYKLTTATGKSIRTTAEHPYLVQQIGSRVARHASPIRGAGWLMASVIAAGDMIAVADEKKKKARAIAFIDYANIKAWIRGKGLSVDLRALRRALDEAGVPDVRFYYGSDPENTKIFSFFRKLESFGYRVITKPVQYFRITLSELLAQAVNMRWLGAVDAALKENLQHEASRLDREGIELLAPKANFDVEIAVDALRCAEDTDTFILFSGDGDFAYLAKELKALGKRVVVVSGRKSLSGALMKEVDKFVTLERLGEQVPGVFAKTQNPPEGRVLKNCNRSIADLLGVSSAPVEKSVSGKMRWERVEKIDHLPAEQVYDIEVDGTHNFIGNDIVAHNTYITGGLGVGQTETTNGNITGTGRLSITSTTATSTLSTGGFTIGTSQFVVQQNSGNVGIGTTSPSATLTVQANGTNIKVARPGGANEYGLFVGSTNFVTLGEWSSGNGLSVNSAGNVGIGTTSPGTLLAITGGTGTYVTSGGLVGIGISSPRTLLDMTANRGDISTLQNSGAVTGVWETFITGAGAGTARGYVGAASQSGAASLLTGELANAFVIRAENALQLGAGGLGGLAVTINTSGNLGIGTTSPSAKFAFTGDGTGATRAFVIADSANTERVSILNNGNVGIGTTGPAASLHVVRSVDQFSATLQNSSSIGSELRIDATGTSGRQYRITSTASGAAQGGGKLIIGDNATGGGDRVTVDSTGNVGIGTAAPAYPLEVRGNSTDFAMRITNTNSSGAGLFIVPGSDSNDGLTINNAANTVSRDKFFGNGNVYLANSAGNVGIGTTGPNDKLEVSGNIRISGNGFLQFVNSGTDNRINIDSSVASNFLRFTRGSSESMRMDSSGNVGIGTTSPWRTFDVNGTVGMKGLTTDTADSKTLCLTASNEVVANSGTTCITSSARFKENIQPLDAASGLNEVMKLNPVSFTYKSSIGVAGVQVGFIAEQMQQIDPRLVVLDASSTPFSVKYENLTAVLAKAIQELNAKISSPTSTSASGILTIDPGIADTTAVLAANLNMGGHKLIDVSRISGYLGKWSIDGDGTFMAVKIITDEIIAQKLTVGSAAKPSGITLYDEATGAPYCVKIRNGAMVSEAGACGVGAAVPTAPSPVPPASPPPAPVPSPAPPPAPAATSTPPVAPVPVTASLQPLAATSTAPLSTPTPPVAPTLSPPASPTISSATTTP